MSWPHDLSCQQNLHTHQADEFAIPGEEHNVKEMSGEECGSEERPLQLGLSIFGSFGFLPGSPLLCPGSGDALLLSIRVHVLRQFRSNVQDNLGVLVSTPLAASRVMPCHGKLLCLSGECNGRVCPTHK